MNTLTKFIITPLSAALLIVAGCSSSSNNCDSGGYECSSENDGGSDNNYGEIIGSVGGAVLGAVIGSEIGGGRGKSAATTLGAVFGMLLGREIGKSIDNGDFNKSEEVAQGSLENNPDGKTSTWNNPDSGNSGTITPQTTYKNDEGADCRDFETTITIDGKTEVAHGRACRQPDGSWKVTS